MQETRKGDGKMYDEEMYSRRASDYGQGKNVYVGSGISFEESERLARMVEIAVGPQTISDAEREGMKAEVSKELRDELFERKKAYTDPWVEGHDPEYKKPANPVTEKILELSPERFDFNGWEKQIGAAFHSVDQYNLLASRKDIANKIADRKDEKTSYSEMKGKQVVRYGFDKNDVFDALRRSASTKPGDEKVQIPQPQLKTLSLADKIKKKLTGTCKTEQENKKIQEQYDSFVNDVKQLLDGIDSSYFPAHVVNVGDLRDAFRDMDAVRNNAIVGANKTLKDYRRAKEYDRIKQSVAYDINQETRRELTSLKEQRQRREDEKRAGVTAWKEQKLVHDAQRTVNEISNPQFRDTDIAKTDSDKEKTAKDRYMARKILKDRGLLQIKKSPVKQTTVSQEMINDRTVGGVSK